MNYILQQEKENILYSIVVLCSLSILLKHIMSLCSAVVVLFYCCMKTLQYKKLSFLLLMDIWVASSFFFHDAVRYYLYILVHVSWCTQEFFQGIPRRKSQTVYIINFSKEWQTLFQTNVMIYTLISCVLPSLANTVRPPPHQSAPIWLPVIVSLCGFSFLIS